MKKFTIVKNGIKTKDSIIAYDLGEAQRIYLDGINISLVEDTDYIDGEKPEKGGEVKYVSN